MRRLPVVAVVLLAVLAALGLVASPAAAQVDPDVTGRLSLFKRIENLDTGASEGRRELWTMTAVNTEDPAYTFTGNGLNGVQSLVVPAGDYTISESGGVPGYAFVSWDCGALGTFTDPTPTITVPADGTVTCTVRNDAIQSSLTLRKVVEGGPAAPSAWNLTAQGPTTLTGPGIVSGPVRIGEYQLSETGGPNGYVAGDWVCTGGTQTGPSTVVVTLDQQVECVITNTRGGATQHLVTLQKQVVGGPATTGDFLLSASGPPGTVEGVSGSPTVTQVPVPSGTYALSETALTPTAQNGYTSSGWTCTGGTLAGSSLTLADADGDAVCTVTNTWTGGTLTLVKEVIGGTVVPAAWTLTATGPVTVTGRSGVPAVTSVPVPAGTYTLTESGPTNYGASPWVCSSGGIGTDQVAVATGADVTCTITNTIEDASLTLVKQVVGGPATADDFTLRAVGDQGVVMVGTSGSAAVTQVEIETGQTWALGEDPVPGYTASPWTCTGEPAVGDQVTIMDPVDVVCTVTNTWTGGTLTLVKEVEGSGTSPAAWLLTAAGPATVTGRSGSPAVTAVDVPDGQYALSESAVAGFTASGWDCGPAPVAGAVVTVTPGADVTCTITNTATQPHLTLTKVVDNSAGGTLEPDDFTLTAAGPVTVVGQTGDPSVTVAAVVPGTYDLSETPDPVDGYAASPWVCTFGGGGLPTVGETLTIPTTSFDGSPYTEDVRCTIVNTAQAPRLTLAKTVDNTGGGPAQPTAWTLLAIGDADLLVGSTGTVSVTDVPVRVGSYSLLELGPPYYALEGWTCLDADGATVPVVGGDVTLGLGDDVTCTAANRWTRAQLTLQKVVDGGVAAPADWTLVASSPAGGSVSGASGTQGVLPAGTYALNEVPQTTVADLGYEPAGWDCGPAHPVTGGTVTLAENDVVTCTVTNTWIGGTLTLEKVVVGGDAQPDDFTLLATGPGGSWQGTDGSTAVTDIPVVPGVYALAEGIGGPAGYREDAWTCDGATLLGDSVVVDAEADVTCAVVNTFAGIDPPGPPPPPVPPGPVNPVTPPSGGGSSGGDAALATTGAPAAGALAALALALLLGGALVRLGTRRR